MSSKPRRHSAALLVSALLAFCSTSAMGQAFRAYLSSDGNDAANCSLPTPCRLLPAALNAVASGGEIWMLDSANYNTAPVTITKSVTILAVPGALGSIVASGGDGLVVNGSNIRVTLRNLVFVNLMAGASGVRLLQGSSLTVVNCSFTRLSAGIAVQASNTTSRTQISKSLFDNNGVGLYVTQGVVLSDDNNFYNNTIAIQAIGNGGENNNNGNGPANGTTRVRISSGNIVDNGTAFQMENTGLRAQGACNASNIFLRQQPQFMMNIHGNTTHLTVLGSSDQQMACNGFYQLGGYGFGVAN